MARHPISSIAALALLALSFAPATTMGQGGMEEIRIGYLLSKRAGLGTHDRAGAAMGAREVNLQAAHLGKRFTILFAHGGKSSEVVAQAKRLIEHEGVSALMGSVSDAATIALANLAQEQGLVFFNVGSSVDSLRGAKCRLNSFSIGPSLTMRVRALGQWAIEDRGWKRWAFIEGESRTEGRLVAAAQEYLRAHGGQVAQVLKISEEEAHDPARIVALIEGLSADFLFVALTGERQTLVLQAYNGGGLTLPLGGTWPEVARFDRYAGTAAGYWSTSWTHLGRRYGSTELNNRFVDFAGIRMEERSWSAWAAVKILGEAVLRVDSPSAGDLVSYLREHVQFDGYQGIPMNFREWNNQLRQPMQIVKANDHPARAGWDTLAPAGRVPLRGLKGWRGNPVDSIGLTRDESQCRW